MSATDAQPPAFSDDALALEFTRRHGDGLAYVATWGKWLAWDGTRWSFDQTVHVFDFARAVCREAASRCNKEGEAKRLASAKTRAAVENLARADRHHAATADQFDADPWLLNTPDGAIDLRTGDMRRARPDDYCTKVTAVGPAGRCPTWMVFLDRITGGDQQLIAFLQRTAGYALTGDTREHSLAFLYGTGANGKSTFLNALSGVMADYHKTAPMEAFTATRSDHHPTELAMLRGARFVTAIETQEGRSWNEARIKALTGGDPIAARFMRQDFFEFQPCFKLVVAGNHKPQIRSVDEAMRRRLHLVPFEAQIPEHERDLQLGERLKAEWPGILEWMIEGCLEWQDKGLSAPDRVLQATREYLSAEDALAAWIEDRCLEGPDYVTSTSDLFGSWKAWAEMASEYGGSMKRFSQNLEARGFRRCRLSGRKGFEGLLPTTSYE